MKRQRPGLRTKVPAVALTFLAAAMMGSAGCQRGGGNGAAAKPANTADTLPDLSAPVKNGDRYKVRADTASFYHYGPQQLNGADQELKKETRITMVQRGRGFSQVRLASGETGFVGTEEITQLTPQEIATEDADRIAATAAAAPPGALNGPVYTIPPEAGRNESLPIHDAPTPTPPPPTIFRY